MIWKILLLCLCFTTVLGAPSFHSQDKKDYLMCQVCHIVVKDMQKLVMENATMIKVEEKINDICNKLPEPTNQKCLEFANSTIRFVFKKLSEGLDPEQICILLKVCPSKHKGEVIQLMEDVPEKQVETIQQLPEPVHNVVLDKVEKIFKNVGANPIECELCKLVVNYVEEKLLTNKSEGAINSTLMEICNGLPGELGVLCKQFEPELLKALVDEFSAVKACKAIRVCTAEAALESGTPVISCSQCKEILEKIDGETGIEMCSQLPGICGKKKSRHHQISLETISRGDDMPRGPAECTLCKFVMTELDAILVNNKTDAAINSSLEQICNSLPGELQGLCLLFAPTLLTAIKNGLDPNMACSSLKLCNDQLVKDGSYEYDLVEEEKRMFGDYEDAVQITLEDVKEAYNVKASPGCTLCKFLVQEIDAIIAQNKSADAINASVYNLCDKLPAPLNSLCTTYASVIVKDIEAGFDPEMTCEKVKLCTNGSLADLELVKLRQSQERKAIQELKASPGCAICKFLVTEIDSYIAQNQSAAAINASVYNLCNKLPAPLNTLCTTYAPIIVKDVEAGFDPETTCEKVKLCTNGTRGLTKEQVTDAFIDLIEEKIQASPGCTLCKFLVQEIDTIIGQNQSAAAINASVYNLCNKLPAPLNSLCTTYAPVIVKDIEAGFDPEMTCDKIKLCTNGTSTEFVAENIQDISNKLKASPGCTLCKFLVQEIDTIIGQNQSAAAINASVYNLCNKLPAPLNSLCTTYAPVIVKDIEAGFDPEMTCDKIKLCTNGTSTIENLKQEKELKEGPQCAICKLLVNEIDALIATNKSSAEINSTVYGLCDKLPAPINTLCTSYAPQIVNDVLNGLNPEQTCDKLKLCTNGTLVMAVQVKKEIGTEEKIEADPRCQLCEFVVQILDDYLQQNKTVAFVNATMMSVCNLLPSSLKPECLLFAPQIVTMVTSGVAPENACKQAKLCPQVTGNNGELHVYGMSCDICHGIVEIFYPDKYDQEFGNEKCGVVCPMARRRRSTDYTKQNVEGHFSRLAKETETWECDLCQFMVRAANSYFENNHTEMSLEEYMNDICNYMPEPFKDVCLKSVPGIIHELAHGFDEVTLCRHYLPDDCNGTLARVEDKALQPQRTSQQQRECDVCINIITYISENLNHDKTEVQLYLNDVCQRLPSATSRTACMSFAEEEYDDINTKIINRILSADDLCHMISLC